MSQDYRPSSKARNHIQATTQGIKQAPPGLYKHTASPLKHHNITIFMTRCYALYNSQHLLPLSLSGAHLRRIKSNKERGTVFCHEYWMWSSFYDVIRAERVTAGLGGVVSGVGCNPCNRPSTAPPLPLAARLAHDSRGIPPGAYFIVSSTAYRQSPFN